MLAREHRSIAERFRASEIDTPFSRHEVRLLTGSGASRFGRASVGEYATAPFLHVAGDLGLPVVARLKGNLPELSQAAQARFTPIPPTATFPVGPDHVEI